MPQTSNFSWLTLMNLSLSLFFFLLLFIFFFSFFSLNFKTYSNKSNFCFLLLL